MTHHAVVHVGNAVDVLRTFEDESVDCVVTSPPYWGLRDYHVEGQIGLEDTPQAFVAAVAAVFAEVHRVLRKDGTCWVNLGDSYANDRKWGGKTGGKHAKSLHGASGVGREKRTTGLPPKSLVGIPWRVAFALQDQGWALRSEIIWHKPNPMPESVVDRPSKAHEQLFLFSKSERYFYDADAVRTPQKTRGEKHEGRSGYRDGHPSKGGIHERKLHPLGANLPDVWTVSIVTCDEAHFAVMPLKLVEPCILAGCPKGGVVLDPFVGSGTVGIAALRHARSFLGVELNPAYAEIAKKRIVGDAPMFHACDVVHHGTERSP